MSDVTELEREAELLASALGATYRLAKLGFDGSIYIRFIFPGKDGAYFNFEMPTDGPHWKALVQMAQALDAP